MDFEKLPHTPWKPEDMCMPKVESFGLRKTWEGPEFSLVGDPQVVRKKKVKAGGAL